MNKVYSRINWENEPSTKTPLNEHNLNKIDFAVDEIDNRVIELDSTKAKNTDLQTLSTRVDNLILNAGDSSAECTDARVTEDGTTYDTLKKRLDAEHSSVIEDISQLSNENATLKNNVEALNIEIPLGNNLYNKNSVHIIEKHIFGNDGAIVSNDEYSVSDYVPVDSGQIVWFARGDWGSGIDVHRVCFYDSNYNYISCSDAWVQYVTIPTGCSFIRVSVQNETKDNFIVTYNSTNFTDSEYIGKYSMVCELEEVLSKQEKCVGYLSDTDGSIVHSPSWYTTDFIDISTGALLKSNTPKELRLCKYDSDKNFLGIEFPKTIANRLLLKGYESDVKYIRFSATSPMSEFSVYPFSCTYTVSDLRNKLYYGENLKNGVEQIVFENFMYKYGCTLGKCLMNDETGQAYNANGIITTECVPLSQSLILKCNNSSAPVWFAYFDANKDFIQETFNFAYTVNGEKVFAPVDGVAYIKISAPKANEPVLLPKEHSFDSAVYKYMYEDMAKDRYVRVGTAKELLEAMAKGGKYYIENGEYDLVEALGEDYLNSFVNSEFGPYINDGEYIFAPNAFVKFNYTGTNQAVIDAFSPINTRGQNIKIVGLNIEASNCKYPIHDELGGIIKTYVHEFVNCTFKHNNCIVCIGGGLGYSGNIIIDGCVFEGGESSKNPDFECSYHNDYREGAKGSITIKNCIVLNGKTFRFGYYGASQLVTDIIVTNCKVGKEPYITAETSEHSPYENMRLHSWNNVIG